MVMNNQVNGKNSHNTTTKSHLRCHAPVVTRFPCRLVSKKMLPSSVNLLLQIGLVFLLAKCTLTIYELFQRRRELQRLTRSFGDFGRKGHFLFGDLYHFPAEGHGRAEYFLATISKWKDIGRVWIGPFMALVIVVSPDYVRACLANADSKDNMMYNFIRPWLGDGLLTSEGKKWSRHRRLLTPGFHYEILKPYIKIFGDSTKEFLGKLAEANGEFLDVFHPVSLMTLDSLLKCSFSYESKCQQNGENPYIQAVYEITDSLVQRTRFFPYHYDPIFYISPLGRRFVKQCRIVHEQAETTIRERRKELERLTSGNETIPRRGRKYMDFLDILIEAKDENGESMTDLEIREEVDTFMFEGHDTTASGISWCLYNLAKHPQYQQKCREEIQKIMLNKDSDDIEWEDLSRLEFTTMFIKESFRIHPPVPSIGRTLIKDVQFPDGAMLPKGTFVTVSILGMHHHPLYWDDPEVFNPYRFSPECSRDRHSHAYVPFSAGPRNCIGKQFAMNEVKIAIATTIHRFLISLDPARIPKYVTKAVLRTFDGLYLKFTPVEVTSSIS